MSLYLWSSSYCLLEIILTLLAPKIWRGVRWAKMDAVVGWPPLQWLQNMSSQTNVASNTITVHLISFIHLSAFLSSPVRSKLAELSFKIRQHLTVFATRGHLWIHFSLGVPALYCKYLKNGTDWLKNMGFLVMLIYWRHLVLTSQWDSKTSECREAVPSANYD